MIFRRKAVCTTGNSREQQYDNGSNQVDLHQFIVETLNRNHKDRMLLLKIENDLVSLAKDPKRTVHKFAQMSSYQRMLVHRVAAYFSMEHNVDTTGVSVIVNTTKATRIPDTRFRDYVRDDLLLPEEPRRSILKRDSSSFDETGSFKSGERMLNGDSRRSKSFEEREEEYEKARRRIFNREHSGDGDVDCLEELQWDQEDGVCSQCEHPAIRGDRNPPRLLKVESYESGEALKANSLRLSVSKSHSFSGYDQPLQTTRILTKQDSGSSMSSRISPSSSGYKSQRSDATLSATPSPTATPNLHTQTGQPYTNADGSIYHYDPSNPPRVCPASGENLTSHQVAAVHHNTTGIPSSSLPTQQQQQQQSKHGEWFTTIKHKAFSSEEEESSHLKKSGGCGRQSMSALKTIKRDFRNYVGEEEVVPSVWPATFHHTSFENPQQQINFNLFKINEYEPFTNHKELSIEEKTWNGGGKAAVVYSVEESGTTYFYSSSEPSSLIGGGGGGSTSSTIRWPPAKQDCYTAIAAASSTSTAIHFYGHYL